ncbi:MAG: DUF885 domain-containing protein [Candidatus Eisenbacteria bacterium]
MLDTEKTFTSLSEEYVEVTLRQDPVAATMAGLHDYDLQLPDHSPDGLRERGIWLRDFDQRLVAAVPWEELPTSLRVDFALLRSRLSVARAELEELKLFARNPVRAVETALYGVFLLAARPFAPIEERKEGLLARLMGIPDYLEGARASLAQPSVLALDVALAVAASGPAYVDDVVRRLVRHFPGEAERIEHAGGRARVGFLEHAQALERDVRPRAGGSFAIGQRWFDWRLEHEHLVGLRAADLDAFGKEAVERAREELELEARSLDPQRPWQELIREAQTRHPEPMRVREAYQAEVARALNFVAARKLVPIPDSALEVVDTPVFERFTTPFSCYLPPAPFDEDQTGWFFVTPVEPSRSRDGATLHAHCDAAITLATVHEGYPGHHLQIATANRNGSRLRRMGSSCLLVEGWALYCEELMHEQGFARDRMSRLYQLRDLLWRACRVVVDVGLQTGGMSVPQAVDYLVENALLARATAEIEVKRYALNPTRPLSFLLGKTLLLELRDETRRRLGSRFNLYDFHAALLASGSVPPALIREELAERLT